ncbi:MAG: XRE family transcriptional regulator [Candidatus Krumholzibacteriia bacterium]
MEIQELGARIKRIRKGKSMTLKDIEARSHVSATHISEIERGKTSPTIGALSRIAAALGKDTAFFLETQNLDDVSHIKYEERAKEGFKSAKGFFQRLTRGIPGGRLQVYRLHLDPGAELKYSHPSQEGEATMVLEQGKLEFTVEDESFTMGPGDSMHFTEIFAPAVRNLSTTDPADLVLISIRRHSIDTL